MTAFLALLRNDLRLVFHNGRTVLLLLLLPLGMLLTVVAALAPMRQSDAFVEPFAIALVDNEQSVWTGMLVRQLDQVTLIDAVYRVDEPEAVRMLESGRVAAAIVIPGTLSGNLEMLVPATARIYGSSQFSLQSNIIRHVGQAGANLVSVGVSTIEVFRTVALHHGMPAEQVQAQLDRIYERFFRRVLARRDIFTPQQGPSMAVSLVEYYGAGLMAVFLLFASLPCMKRFAQDRQCGVSRRFRTTPVPAWMPVVSQLFVSMLVSALQFTLLLGVMVFGFQAWLGVSPVYPAGLFLGTVLASSGFSLLVAAAADSPVTVDVVGNLGVLAMAVAGGSLYPPTAMPDWVRPLSVLTVVRWTREGFLGVFSGNLAETGRCIGMLFVLAAAFLTGAALLNRFRRGRL